MQLSKYSLERLREDGKFILYRAHRKQIKPPSVLLLAQASTGSNPKTLTRIDHEYPLRSELDSACAARPLALSERSAQMTLLLEDPGFETLDGFISGPMELTRFLRFGVTLATALGALDQRRRITAVHSFGSALNGYIATSQSIRWRFTNKRRVCRPASL